MVAMLSELLAAVLLLSSAASGSLLPNVLPTRGQAFVGNFPTFGNFNRKHRLNRARSSLLQNQRVEAPGRPLWSLAGKSLSNGGADGKGWGGGDGGADGKRGGNGGGSNGNADEKSGDNDGNPWRGGIGSGIVALNNMLDGIFQSNASGAVDGIASVQGFCAPPNTGFQSNGIQFPGKDWPKLNFPKVQMPNFSFRGFGLRSKSKSLDTIHTLKTQPTIPDVPKNSRPQHPSQGLCNLVAGAIAGAVASAVTCPLEVVKTQLQSRSGAAGIGAFDVARKIISEQGVKGLYRGLAPGVIASMPTRAFYFWALGAARSLFLPLLGDTSSMQVASSVSAGFLRNTAACPIFLTKTRMQLEGAGFMNTAQNIFKTQGVAGFYRGLGTSYWGLLESAIYSFLYDKSKGAMLGSANGSKLNLKGQSAGRPTTGQYLLSAGLSKAVASIMLYPHEVVLTRMSAAGSARYASFFQSIALIAKEEGAQGLYAGLGPHLLKVVPSTAITFMVFEVLSRQLPLVLEQRPWESVASDIKRGVELFFAPPTPPGVAAIV